MHRRALRGAAAPVSDGLRSIGSLLPAEAQVRRLILVKHSLPEIEPAVLSHHWRLGEEDGGGARRWPSG